jgi:hypothetical protein
VLSGAVSGALEVPAHRRVARDSKAPTRKSKRAEAGRRAIAQSVSMNKYIGLLVVLGIASIGVARADERFFGYVYESEVLPKGRWEFEQWLTLRQGYPDGDRNFTQSIWDFREEFEYGLTDRLSASMYLNFRNNQYVARTAGFQDTSDFNFAGISAEFKYQWLNPNTKPIGLALYVEPTYNGGEQELEYKLIVSKVLGEVWVFGGNLTYEQEWEQEEGEHERESVFEATGGAAYRFTPHWSAGIEARFHSVYEGLSFGEQLGRAWFVGPNVHYGSAKYWGTLTVLPQLSGEPSDGGINRTEHQTFETRLIFGINF